MGEAIIAGNNFELIKKVYVKNLTLHGHTVSSESRGTSHLAAIKKLVENKTELK